jgi:hypothetical protein
MLRAEVTLAAALRVWQLAGERLRSTRYVDSTHPNVSIHWLCMSQPTVGKQLFATYLRTQPMQAELEPEWSHTTL